MAPSFSIGAFRSSRTSSAWMAMVRITEATAGGGEETDEEGGRSAADAVLSGVGSARGAGRSAPRRHVVLVGTMGSGKSTVGRLVAGELGWPFWDNDERLVLDGGKSAAEIAQRRGADDLHRREIETLIRGLDGEGPSVVAAAASVVL